MFRRHECFAGVIEYYIKDGLEKTAAFFTEGQSVNSYSSCINQVPSRHFLECSEDCILRIVGLNVISDQTPIRMHHKITPRIEKLAEKKLVGHKLKMSLVNNKTAPLWGRFRAAISAIKNRVTEDKISMQIYPPSYYENFSPEHEFEKWATVEVDHFEDLPSGMEAFTLKEGLYAVFDYKGSSADTSIFQYIFWEWLPNSAYQIDDRPHFEVLGANYKNNDPNSEEEIWVPVRKE